jgi:EAL domain-containing protein (putative c-di-GMP-specific phosphodiesterase class I)
MRVLKETGLPAEYLELEITEGVLMENVEATVKMLNKLKSTGVRLSIDDFGTGYSSLNYLKRFPVDKIKIDRSFVSDITTDGDDAAIVKTIITLAHNLNHKVVAEGVETEEELEFLCAHGCDEVQGYYFSRPLPPDEFEKFLKEEKKLYRKTPA